MTISATTIPTAIPLVEEPMAKRAKIEEEELSYVCCNGEVKLRPLPEMGVGSLAAESPDTAFVEFFPIYAQGVFEQQRSQFAHFWNRRKIVPLSDGTTIKEIFNQEDNDFFQRLAGFVKLIGINPAEQSSDMDLWIALHRDTSSQFRRLVKRYDLAPSTDDPPLIAESKKFLLDFSQLLYRRINPEAILRAYTISYIENNVGISLEDELRLCNTTDELATLIRTVLTKLKSISTDPKSLCYYKTDFYKAGYIPTLNFRAFDVDFLLSPHPIKSTKSGGLKFHGEFETYLDSIKINNSAQKRTDSHMYINLMCRRSISPTRLNEFKEEIDNSSTIESYQQQYPNELIVVGLDRTSMFYYQYGKYRKKVYSDIEAFRNDCLFHLFQDNKTSFFFLPEILTKEKCIEIFDVVYLEYFNLEFLKSFNQRTAFLEIFLAKIVAYLCKELSPSTVNVSCLRTIDRGPSFLAILYCLNVQETKGRLDHEDKMKIMTLLFAPGAFSSNRAIHEERIVIFNLALKKLFPTSSFNLEERELLENNH